MRPAVLLLALFAGCRSGPWDLADGGDAAAPPRDFAQPPIDFAQPPIDFSSSDLANSCGGTMECGIAQVCVFLNRGDCSMYLCADVPDACGSTPSCGCLGDAFCKPFAQSPDEMLTCTNPTPSWLPPGTIECLSPIQCV